MAPTAPKPVVQTARAATDLLAFASLVAILDGQEHSVKREVIMCLDNVYHIIYSLHRIHIIFSITTQTKHFIIYI